MKKIKRLVWLAALFTCSPTFSGVATAGQVAHGITTHEAGMAMDEHRITLNVTQVPIRSLFDEIHRQTKLDFVFNNEQLQTMPLVTVKATDEPVAEVLSRVFAGTDFSFKISSRIITVSKKEEVGQKVGNKRAISGKVTDSFGDPCLSVTVQLKGTKIVTITDLEGRYSLVVPDTENALLSFSFIGMKTKLVALKNRSVINVQMQEDAISVGDVVIVGAYGTAQKRSDQVGSAYQVGADQLKSLPALRVDKLLDGLVPGMKIDPNTDSPDNTRPRYNLRVRGDASLSASNEPLWVVDGTPIYTGESTNLIPGLSSTISPLSFINPDDIESFTVLKDATATSIYGADGANGVILITTKKGREGKTRLHVLTQYGIAQIDKSTKYKMLNAKQYLGLAKEAYQNAGNDMRYFPFTDNESNAYTSTDTDWSDVFYGTGNTWQTNLSLEGGTEASKYYISGAYFENSATIKGNKQQRMSVRTNIDMNLNRKLKAVFNLNASYNINDLFNPGTDYYEFLPIVGPYNADGTFRLYNTTIEGKNAGGSPNWVTNKFFNSVAEREENVNNQKTLYTSGNLLLEYKIMKGLTYTVQLGVDYQSSRDEQYSARTNWSGMTVADGPIGYSSRSTLNLLNWTNVHRLNFNRSFGKHTVGVLAALEAGAKEYTTVGATGSGFINDKIQDVSYAEERLGSNSSSTTRKASMLFQGSYSYDRRYYLTFNGRRDGNSRFGTDVRWGNFGSVGASWNVHNESFYSIPWMNIMKIKASYGANGNSRLGSQEALGLYKYGESYRYAGESGGVMAGASNPNLSWETTYMTNVGLRVRLFNRLDVEIEGYHNKTINLLSQLDVSRATGDTRVYRNVGTILNKGLELTISSENFKPKEEGGFGWTTDLNMSHNSNKLLKLYNGISKNMGQQVWKEGYDIHTYNLVRWAGVDPRDGAPLWYDANGNITRTYNTDDRMPSKNSTPILFGGITNTFEYKNFELRALLNYTIGGYAYSSFGRNSNSDGLNIMSENQSVDQLDRWQKPGDLALNPKPLWGISTSSVMGSTRYLYNKTMVRLQNVVLTYHVPVSLLRTMGINNCSLSFIGDNLLAWSPYSSKNRNSYKTSMSGYPLERGYSFSLNFGL